jgi:hypothetical protein
MSSGTIVVVKPGHKMDPEYRVKLLEENPIHVNVAVTDKKTVEVQSINSNELDLLTSLSAVEEAFKDHLLIVRASNEEVVSGEEQPFELIIDKEGKPLLVAFVEGEFTKYASPEATLSPEATFVENWLADKVNTMYASCGRDIHKLMNLLDVASFQEEARKHMEPRGVVVFFSTDNSVVYLAKSNGNFGKFDWGEVSNTHGYTEAKKVPDNPAGTDLSQLTYAQRKALKLKGKTSVPVINDGQKEPPTNLPEVPDKPAEPVTAPAKEIETKVFENGAIKTVRGQSPLLFPPSTLSGRDLRKWYGRHRKNGTQSIDANQRPGIPASEVHKNSHFYLLLNPVSKETEVKPKDTTVHIQPDPQVVAKPTPIMPPDQVQNAVNTLNKYKPATQEDLERSLEKYSTFSGRLERSLDEILLAPFEAYYEIGQNGVKGLAMLAHEIRMRVLMDNPNIMANAHKQVTPAATEKPVEELTYAERKALKIKQKQQAA